MLKKLTGLIVVFKIGRDHLVNATALVTFRTAKGQKCLSGLNLKIGIGYYILPFYPDSKKKMFRSFYVDGVGKF